ncbi:MAG: hypothetical protein NZN45_09325 [Rhodovarius sp.]|nr:hypothetical protein [Rhodovarius sp.]
MRILYYSVHAVLEYDEVGLLRRLGHEVLSLGEYFDAALRQGMRPPLPESPAEAELRAAFHAEGCRFRRFCAPEEVVLTPAFLARCDAVVVMHSTRFIEHHWEVLRSRPVILRCIGVDLDSAEPRIAALRARGVKVVRYAATEERAPGYAGADALIRFHKDPEAFLPWSGHQRQVLMFAMALRRRFPLEAALWEETVAGLPAVLAGAENEGSTGAVGFVDHDRQRALLAESRAYLYASGLHIPYTLNLIEAWMAGIPLIALDDRLIPRALDVAEWPMLLRPGHDSLLARSPAEAREMLTALFDNHGFAARLGAEGRAAAIRLFGTPRIAPQWQALLQSL